MDKELANRLNDEEYKNWLKVSQALIQTKEALHEFSREVIEKVHVEILKRTGSSHCDGTCKTNKGKTPSCASCINWVKEIKSYNKGQLNWKNTEPTKWHDVPWEIAKCFMNPQGSKATAAQNTGPEKTDVCGLLNVVVNCKEFGNYLKEKKYPQTVREIRNIVMHSPTMSFPEDVMKNYLNSMITFLEDELHLKNSEACKAKVRMLKLLRDGEFEIRPEVEIDCLEGVLKGHELLLESGGEVDSKTRESFYAISRWITNHRDLAKKFDKKLNKITDQMKDMADHFETRMTSLDFSHGELNGKIEWLVSRVSELEKDRGKTATAGATSPRAAKEHNKPMYKNSLQCYTQKKNLGIPEYSHKETDLKFFSTVTIAGREFTSKEPKASKKEADQSAAEEALTVFTNEVSNENNEKEPASPPSNESPAVLPKVQKEKSTVSCKNQLQEIAQVRKILLPSYETDKDKKTGLFLSKVFFGGVWYSPDTPQVRKTEAEQKAAQFVLAYLEAAKKPSDENCKSPSSQETAEAKESITTDAMLSNDVARRTDHFLPSSIGNSTSSLNASNNEMKSPKKSLSDDAESQLCTPTSDTTDATDNHDGKKSFKSKLNEYAQVKSPGIPAKYEDINCSSGFRCKVTINDLTYEGKTCKSKKEAKELAAKEAWCSLNAQAVSPPKVSPSGLDRYDFVLLSSPNETSPKDSASKCSSADTKECNPDELLDASSEISSLKKLPSSSVLNKDDDAFAFAGISSSNVDTKGENSRSEIMQPDESDRRKRYKSKLNEYCQSVDTAHKTLEYIDSSCDLGFLCKVIVMGTTYESISPQKSKKEAREQAARQACLALGVEQKFGNGVLPEPPEALTGAVGQAYVIQGETTPQDEREPNSKETVAPDGPRIAPESDKDMAVEIEQKRNQAAENTKNFKGILLGHASHTKIIPKYVTKQVEETKEFISKVFLEKRCFKGEKAPKKKDAEQNAAKVALEELASAADNRELVDECEALLKEYQENIAVDGDFPKYDEVTAADGDKFVVMVTIVKRWKASLQCGQKKKDVEEGLAENAIKLLEKEGKIVHTAGTKNCRARLNQFCQLQRNVPAPDYDVIGKQERFSGILSFYTLEKYESLSPQSSKDKASASAARSACNDLDLI